MLFGRPKSCSSQAPWWPTGEIDILKIFGFKEYIKEYWGILREAYFFTVAEATACDSGSILLCINYSFSSFHCCLLPFTNFFSNSPSYYSQLLSSPSPHPFPPQVCRAPRCGAAEGVSTGVRLPRPRRLRYECGQCVGKSSILLCLESMI